MTPARWYLVASDMVVVAFIYLLVGYAVLSLALRDDNIVMRLLRAVTSPVRAPIAAVTPRLVPRAIVAVYAVACLYVIRIALFVAAQSIR
jgi:uncharacterized protein YggT (Ycf19 family)